MNKELSFLKTTIIAGLLVLVPIAAVMAVIGFIVNTVVTIATPILGKMPIETLGGFLWVIVFALFLLVAICFMAGLFVQMRIGRLTQEWVESRLLQRLPGYHMFKNLTRQVVGQEGIEFAPALVDLHGSGARVLGLIVEEHAAGYYTIFVPHSPTVTLGQVYFLPGDRVTKVQARLVDVVNSLTQWGMESGKFFQPPQGS
jgi:uncharacterized membrane protein